jgi:hypothetical protein
LVEHAAVVSEGGRFACGRFVFAHKQMDVDAQSGVADDLLAALARFTLSKAEALLMMAQLIPVGCVF